MRILRPIWEQSEMPAGFLNAIPFMPNWHHSLTRSWLNPEMKPFCVFPGKSFRSGPALYTDIHEMPVLHDTGPPMIVG